MSRRAESGSFKLFLTLFIDCVGVSAENVGVPFSCEQEMKLLNSGKRFPLKEGKPLLIMDQHIGSQEGSENPMCK